MYAIIKPWLSNVKEIPVQPPETFHYVYLLQTRECRGSNVYKIGKTTHSNTRRASQYPNHTVLILHIEVDNCHTAERELLRMFKQSFRHRNDLGAEYFEGCKSTMIVKIVEYAQYNYPRDNRGYIWIARDFTVKYLRWISGWLYTRY